MAIISKSVNVQLAISNRSERIVKNLHQSRVEDAAGICGWKSLGHERRLVNFTFPSLV